MNDLKERIKACAKSYRDEISDYRRHLHAHPELSGKEFQTADFITDKLDKWGIPYQKGVAGTGIVAKISGKPAAKEIALRADMDALPITEMNDVPYKSLNPGVMHACGHDVHMASLLGAAKILNELTDEFSGTVRLIFQPSEEAFPGGAKGMIEEGALEHPVPVAILGQHTLPTLEAGKVGMKAGKYMASTDEIYLTVKGKGGHAATPDLLVDTVTIGAQIVIALQQLVSRKANPAIPTLLSFGRFIADGRTNIIPDVVEISGTFRTFDEKWRAEAHTHIEQIAGSVARAFGAECEVFIHKGYPFLVNDEKLTNRSFLNAVAFLGAEKVVELDSRMTAEDFAYFSQKIPGCFYRLGVRNEALGITHNLHTQKFDVDELSLETGMGLMAWLTICEINNQG
jgi:amidohydrolase